MDGGVTADLSNPNAFLGKALESEEIQKFFDLCAEYSDDDFVCSKTYSQPKKYGREGEQSKVEYYRNPKAGLEFQFIDDKLDSIFIYGNGDKEFKKFPGKLPFKLTWDMMNVDVFRFLGEPNTKSGGNTNKIYLAYSRLGLDLTFVSCSWTDLKNPIHFITIYKASTDDRDNICGVCRKPNCYNVCGKCRMIYYCGEPCQKKNWELHKPLCK